MRIKIPKKNLPKNFEIKFIELCPDCNQPIIFGESDTGFNTITNGDICCYSLVQKVIDSLQKEGWLESGPTTLDVLQAEEVE